MVKTVALAIFFSLLFLLIFGKLGAFEGLIVCLGIGALSVIALIMAIFKATNED